jgi:hypothetical protein
MAHSRQAIMSMARPKHPQRWTSFTILLIVLANIPALHAQEAKLSAKLSDDEQARLAKQFAPVLVFHNSEKFFPTSPFFSVDTGALGTDRETTIRLLGTTETRTAAYLELNLAGRVKAATVYFRAYPARRSGKPVVVLEYWFYYVRDEYRVRGNILPIWAGGSHPNDLEHIHLVLRDESPGDFVVDEVYSSAHEGKIPANRYKYDEAGIDGPTHFLVELGSHAMAPDIDEDGIFTPGTDGDSGSKIQWGIRDRGYSWPRYRRNYMTPRSNGNAVILAGQEAGDSAASSDGTSPGSRLTYRLTPVDSLNESFAQLDLTAQQRKDAFETATFWFPRVFGRDNGRSNALLIPAEAKSGGKSVGVLGVSSSERFFLVGAALNVDDPGFLVGARYSFLTRSLFVPDVVLQTDGIVTHHEKYLTPQFLLSYPFDGFTRIMFGKSLITDILDFSRRQWNTVGTIEVRLGDMRISATARSVGPISGAAKEFRLFYAF